MSKLPTREMLNTLPGYYVYKDLNSNILVANDRMSEIVGYNNIQDYFGKTDYDIKSKAVECADLFIKQDQAVIAQNQSIQFIDFNAETEYKTALLKTKSAIHDDNGNVIGTVISTIPIQHDVQTNLIRLLSQDQSLMKISHYSDLNRI